MMQSSVTLSEQEQIGLVPSVELSVMRARLVAKIVRSIVRTDVSGEGERGISLATAQILSVAIVQAVINYLQTVPMNTLNGLSNTTEKGNCSLEGKNSDNAGRCSNTKKKKCIDTINQNMHESKKRDWAAFVASLKP